MMNDRKPTIREVLLAEDSALPKAHRIIASDFAKAEVVSQVEWRDSLLERQARLWTDLRWHLVVAETGSRGLRVATDWYLGNLNAGVIGYLGVARWARGLGLGPRLLGRFVSLFQRDARRVLRRPLQGVIGEIARDNPWLATLHKRNNVVALDFPYLQPSLWHSESPVPLVMYYESLDRVRRGLPAQRVRQALYTIWRRIYRIRRPLADAAFRQMLDALADRTFVGRVRTSGSGGGSGRRAAG